MNAIGLIQGSPHSIKENNLKFLVLKLDLIKAYDRVNWDYG